VAPEDPGSDHVRATVHTLPHFPGLNASAGAPYPPFSRSALSSIWAHFQAGTPSSASLRTRCMWKSMMPRLIAYLPLPWVCSVGQQFSCVLPTSIVPMSLPLPLPIAAAISPRNDVSASGSTRTTQQQSRDHISSPQAVAKAAGCPYREDPRLAKKLPPEAFAAPGDSSTSSMYSSFRCVRKDLQGTLSRACPFTYLRGQLSQFVSDREHSAKRTAVSVS